MLFLRRLLSSILDLVIFIIITLSIYPLLRCFHIELEYTYFILLTFSVSFLIPILVLKTTLGSKFLKLYPNSSKRLLIKYIIYYVLVSGLFGGYISLFCKILNIQKILVSYSLVIMASLITIFIVTNLIFLFSVGRFNLFDYFLKITYTHRLIKRNPVLILLIWLNSNLILALMLIFVQKVGIKSFYDYILKPNKMYSISNYFPREVFDNYSTLELVKYEKNNEILTFSNTTSFYQDAFLSQKTIFSLINKTTHESIYRRKRLCAELLSYALIDGAFSGDKGIDQTKFVLIYREPHSYFSSMVYVYQYYYDNKDHKFSIYGGINLDSLISYYQRRPQNYQVEYLKAIANLLGITVDSLKKREDKKGVIKLSKDEVKKVNVKPLIIPRTSELVIRIIGFEEVKPSIFYTVNFPFNSINSIDFIANQNFDEKFYEALAYRDINFYNDLE
jgi:hypothetical protein